MRPKVLFLHYYLDCQYRSLHNYLNDSGLAESFLLCRADDAANVKSNERNIYFFNPDGDPLSSSYYYTWYLELGVRISKGAIEQVEKLVATQSIEIIVSHSCLGAASLLFNRVGIPIVTYLEFLSYRHHGWDPNYPPTDHQLLNDNGHEMMSLYHLQKSEAVIVPSKYVFDSIPAEFKPKTNVIMDGFPMNRSERIAPGAIDTDERKIGFSARVLSSEKGFETFIQIALKILQKDPNIQFEICGAPKGVSYGYENIEVQRALGANASFKDYLLQKYIVPPQNFRFHDWCPYEEYLKIVGTTTIWLYPILYGSATWGLFELLRRSRCVIASDRVFCAEVITDAANGFLLPPEDHERWVDLSLNLINNPQRCSEIGARAYDSSKKYDVSETARHYLKLFKDILKR